MRVLAVDPGEKRIGLAISDEAGLFARPLKTILHVSREKDADQIITIAQENACDLLLIGQPLDSHGQIGVKARSSQRLADAISRKAALPVHLWDESHSTRDIQDLDLALGKSKKFRREPKDARAAALFLDEFLRSIKFAQIKKVFTDGSAQK